MARTAVEAMLSCALDMTGMYLSETSPEFKLIIYVFKLAMKQTNQPGKRPSLERSLECALLTLPIIDQVFSQQEDYYMLFNYQDTTAKLLFRSKPLP